jgi:4-amino-4-deoxy-L-arabinose transferase-like glycosyltransferase
VAAVTTAAESSQPFAVEATVERVVGASRPVPLTTPLKAVVVASLLVIVAVGTWNAWEYPTSFGYDATANISYATDLIHHGHIPSQTEGGEFYTPPGYYAVAGAALWVGEWLGLPQPERLAVQLNVVFVLATALLVLWLGALLFPARPLVRVGAVAFFAFLPVVSKTAAMVYPEPLNMLVAAAAIALATWMLRYRRFGARQWIAIAILLGLGQLIRSSAVFTLFGVGLALAIGILADRAGRRSGLRGFAIGLAALVVLVAPWYARQAIRYHTPAPISVVPGFVQDMLHPGRSVIATEGGLSHYFAVPVGTVYHAPYRPNFTNEAIPETYTDLWSDWLGFWEWRAGNAVSTDALHAMRDQLLLGVLPTLLAVGGWGWLLRTGLRRRRELLPLALVPLVALFGYLYRSYASATLDGDLFKSSYILITAPSWALGFGVALERLTRRSWPRIALVSALVLFALLDLRFLVYGQHVGGGL